MKQKLNVGIAGYGIIGKRRRFFIDKHPWLKTVAVCDRTFENGGCLDNGVRFHDHYLNLLKEDIDILFVCLTNDVAAEVTIAGLESGCHVFCEKPPGRNLEDIAKVITCEKKHSELKLKYGFNHRYHDSVQDAIAIIQKKELGELINLKAIYGKSKFISFGQESDWRTKRDIAGGGILLDQGIHMVDLLRLFAGKFTQIYSFVSNGFWLHDVEDNAYALMRTEEGVIAFLHSSATQWRHRFQLEMTLQQGAIILSGILSGSRSYGAETMTVVWASEDDRGDPKEQTTRYIRDPSWENEIDEFTDAIINDRPILHGSSSEALETMEIVYRIYCSDPDWKKKWNLMDSIPNIDYIAK